MPQTTLQEILQSLDQVIASDLAVILRRIDDDSLQVYAHRGRMSSPKLDNLRIDLNRMHALREALKKEGPQLMAEEHAKGEPDTYEAAVTMPGDHSCLVTPLRLPSGPLLGALTLDAIRCDAFSREQIRAVEAFAQLAGKLIVEEDRAEVLERDLSALAAENATLRDARAAGVELIGAARPWLRVLEQVRLVSPTPATVLLTGETGTGKEQVARAIHALSARAQSPFVALNCSVLTGDMALSELFGHERGAYTGADRRRAGRFELAKGGTFFLDEVGDLPAPAQVQLLRVLQERVFERMGGEESIEADVRLVAATHRDLRHAVAGGTFREDLYYRLNAFPVHLPPLRERIEDVVPLAAHFVKMLVQELEMPGLLIDAAALRELTCHTWPGNVRELQNVLRRGAILAGGRAITPEYLDFPPSQSIPVPAATPVRAERQDSILPEGLNRLERAQAREVLLALEEAGGTVGGKSGAAVLLGVPPTTLHSLMQRLGLK